MKSETKKKKGTNEPSLNIPGKLPFADYASEVMMADLVKMLVHTGALSVRDYELLVLRGHMIPLAESMTKDNWSQIRDELLEFMYEEYPDNADDAAEPKEAGVT